MAQHYIGVKQVEAWPEERDGVSGYGVRYSDRYKSWSPKDVFEAAYLPMGGKIVSDDDDVNDNTITQEMVDDFIDEFAVYTEGKTTIVHARLRNGFEIVESSSCVDPVNYNEEVGKTIALERIKSKVCGLLGFVLQWARTGLCKT